MADVAQTGDFVLTYPSVDNITQEILKLGKGCKFLKLTSVGHFSMSLGIWISWAFTGGVLHRFFGPLQV